MAPGQDLRALSLGKSYNSAIPHDSSAALPSYAGGYCRGLCNGPYQKIVDIGVPYSEDAYSIALTQTPGGINKSGTPNSRP